MNKKFYSLIAAAIVSVSAFAQEPAKTQAESEAMDYCVYIEDARVDAKTTKNKLKVMMNNAAPVCLWQADVFLPKGVTMSSSGNLQTKTRLVVTNPDDVEEGEAPIYSHSLSFTPQKGVDGVEAYTAKATELVNNGYGYGIRMLAFSDQNIEFTGTKGQVAQLSVDVAEGVADGDYAIEVWTQCIVDKAAESHAQGWTTATLTVGEGTGVNGIVEDANSNAPIYNLNGQIVNKAQKGVFIQNGKKVAKK